MMPEHAWTRAQIRWLGRVPDRTIARRIGISDRAVRRKRVALGIAPAVAHEVSWSRAALDKLGKVSDAALAAELGVSRLTVFRKRKSLSLPASR